MFQKVRAPFSAAGINSILDTLKLMVPQMGDPARRLIGFRNGVFDTVSGQFSAHRQEHWLRTVNSVDYTPPRAGEPGRPCAALLALADAGRRGNHDKQERILAALLWCWPTAMTGSCSSK